MLNAERITQKAEGLTLYDHVLLNLFQDLLEKIICVENRYYPGDANIRQHDVSIGLDIKLIK